MDRVTWQFINSFADWLSAIGTIAAVVVALYLARRDRRLSVRLTNGVFEVIQMGSGNSVFPRFVQLRVVNTGMRDLIVNGVFWETGWFRKRSFIQIASTDPLSAQLPKRIAHGEEASIMYPIEDFRRGAPPLVALLKQSWIARRATGYIRTGFYFSTGEQASTPLDKSLRDLLMEMTAT